MVEATEYEDGHPDSAGGVPPVLRWDEATFNRLVRDLVDDTAPRLFALVEEAGDREDGWVLARGIQFTDGATLLNPEGRPMGSCTSAISAHQRFSQLTRVRLIWPDRDPAPAEPATRTGAGTVPTG